MAKTNRVLVLIADGSTGGPNDYGMEAAGLILPPIPVPVSWDFEAFSKDGDLNKVIGMAELTLEGGRLYAVIDFRGADTQVDKLANAYPAIGGMCIDSDHERGVVTKCKVTHLGITKSNIDKRIKTLGEQGAFEKKE